MTNGEEQTGVCPGRDGKGAECTRDCVQGPAALPPAALQTTPPCTRMQSRKARGSERTEQLFVVGRALMKA